MGDERIRGPDARENIIVPFAVPHSTEIVNRRVAPLAFYGHDRARIVGGHVAQVEEDAFVERTNVGEDQRSNSDDGEDEQYFSWHDYGAGL